MGCCCPVPVTQPKNEPRPAEETKINASQRVLSMSDSDFHGPINAKLGLQYRGQGKEHFKRKQYDAAISSYCLALKNNSEDFANYTNLALAYKAKGRLQDSVSIIDKLLCQKHLQGQQLKFIVKGKIIKSRCETLLAKNYYIETPSKQDKASDEAEALLLIKRAVSCLEGIVLSKMEQNLGKSMQVQKYLENANKVLAFIKQLGLCEEDEKLLKYIASKYSEIAEMPNFQKIAQFFQQPSEISEYLTNIMRNSKGSYKIILDEQENEEFLTDPITYEFFTSPIIVQSGITYEQSCLKQHLKKNGSTDPITRQQLDYKNGRMGIRNHAIQRYIKEFKHLGGMKKQQLLNIQD